MFEIDDLVDGEVIQIWCACFLVCGVGMIVGFLWTLRECFGCFRQIQVSVVVLLGAFASVQRRRLVQNWLLSILILLPSLNL